MKKIVFLTALLPMSSFAEIALDTQKVTASKITNSQLSNSIVITREEIELLQASNLSEVLSQLPGFQVTQQGGNANAQSFVMNGFRSSQMLILLNGQRFSSATLGSATYSTIPANSIKKIEIVSNARSAIYGADAMGGVINIVTTQDVAEQQLLNNNIHLALGNQGTSQFSTDLNKTIGDLSLHLSGFTEKTQGYDVYEANDHDRDGSERHALGLDASYKINNENTLTIANQNNRGSVDYDGRSGSGHKKDYQQQVATIGWQYSDEKFGVSANYGESFDKSWNYGNGTSRSDANGFITETKTIDVSARAKISKAHALLVVSDYREDDISKSDNQYDKTNGDTYGFGLSHNYTTNKINTELGLRRDDSSLFDENYSYSASAEWFALEQLSIIAAFNTGFKAPSFNDLYYPISGNKDLKPEKSLNRRLAIQYNKDRASYKASYQLSHVDNLIQWVPNSGGMWQPTNVNQALLRNSVLSWDYNWLTHFSSQLSYEWNHSVDLKTHNRLPRQSSRVAKLNLNYDNGQYSVGSSMRYLSESYDNASNSNLLAAYTAADAYAKASVSENFSFGLRINNLTNKTYQSAKGYPAQERTYLISGTFNF
jgi:vitamin B12 transporter